MEGAEMDGAERRLASRHAHEAGHLLEGGLDRHHAERHRGALEFAGDAAELAEVAREIGAGRFQQLGILHDHGFGNDEFADEVDERGEFCGVHFDEADGAGTRAGGCFPIAWAASVFAVEKGSARAPDRRAATRRFPLRAGGLVCYRNVTSPGLSAGRNPLDSAPSP